MNGWITNEDKGKSMNLKIVHNFAYFDFRSLIDSFTNLFRNTFDLLETALQSNSFILPA